MKTIAGWILAGTLWSVATCTSWAQEKGTAEAEVRRPLAGRFVEEVLVPVPSEVFGVLDKLGGPDWSRYREKRELPVVADRKRLGLLFGIAVAEGFIAVEAEEPEGMQEIGSRLLRLASALGLRKEVEGHAGAVLASAEARDWDQVRREFDKSEVTVRRTMTKLKDGPLAHLVSIGGWLRGTEAATAVMMDDYSEDASELLAQVHIVDHFLAQLPEDSEGLLADVRKGLTQIRDQIVVEPGTPIELAKVQKVHQVSALLVDRIAGWEVASP